MQNDQQPRYLRPRMRRILKDHSKKRSLAPQPEFSATSFVDRVQIHGLIDFYQATSWLARLFWLVLLATCMTIAVYSIWESFNEYVDQPVQTTVTKTPKKNMTLPPVYICPFNYIHYEKARRLGKENLAFWVAGEFYTDIFQGHIFHNLHRWREERKKIKTPANISKDYSMSDFRRTVLSVSFTEFDIFKICYLVTNNEGQDCIPHIYPQLDPHYGVCYKVVNDHHFYQKRPGDGLLMFIDLHAKDYNPIIDAGSIFTGAIIKFGKYARPFTYGGYLAGPGRFVRYSMYKQVNRLLPSDKKSEFDCADTDKTPQLQFLNASYSPEYCSYDCFLRTTVRMCNCTFTPFDTTMVKKQFWKTPICTKKKKVLCFQVEGLISAYNKALDECTTRCIEKCETEEYEIYESSMELGSPQLRTRAATIKLTENLSHLEDPEYWQTSAVMVHIAFTELSELVIQQSSAITVVQLISDIGGQAGLWLGASIFTVCQISTLLLSWLYTKVLRGKSNSRKTSKAAEKKAPLKVVKKGSLMSLETVMVVLFSR